MTAQEIKDLMHTLEPSEMMWVNGQLQKDRVVPIMVGVESTNGSTLVTELNAADDTKFHAICTLISQDTGSKYELTSMSNQRSSTL